jgi:hypothetical protein
VLEKKHKPPLFRGGFFILNLPFEDIYKNFKELFVNQFYENGHKIDYL